MELTLILIYLLVGVAILVHTSKCGRNFTMFHPVDVLGVAFFIVAAWPIIVIAYAAMCIRSRGK